MVSYFCDVQEGIDLCYVKHVVAECILQINVLSTTNWSWSLRCGKHGALSGISMARK